MNIRTKFLLVMAGLLVLLTTLSFFLHLEEGGRIQKDLEDAVARIVRGVVAETEPGGLFAPQGGESPAATRLVRVISLRPHLDFGDSWNVRIEAWTQILGENEDPYESRARRQVIPAEVLEATLLKDFSNPIRAAREESLPREIAIAGAVLAVGLVLVGLVSSRLVAPIKELTEKMERVAAGDLSVRIEPRTRDEVRQMSVAFNSMVDHLRDKRDLERKMFQAERLSAMGNLAAGVAHDIRNPLNTIGLTLAHLREQFGPDDAAARGRFLGHIDDMQGELERLNALVKNFLSLAHPDRGERTSSDLGEIVDDCLRLFRKEADSRGVRLTTAIEPLPRLHVNPQQIRSALTNLVLNALQAMEGGGGELSIGGRVAPSGEVELVIRDSGKGIAPEDLDKVFLPYFTTREDGTGLGLPVARSAIEANGGRLELTSRPGRGTEVTIVLPAAGGVPGGSDGPSDAGSASRAAAPVDGGRIA